MKAADNKWVRLRAFEVEAALNAAYTAGYGTGPDVQKGACEILLREARGPAWGQQSVAYANGAEVHKKAEVEAARREVLATNLKVLDAAARTASAAGQTVEALARLVDNMGRLG